jgi:hypothetical protein
MTITMPPIHACPDETAVRAPHAAASLPATDATARFEDLPSTTRHAAERAACQFLVNRGYVSLDEACQTLGLTLPDLWCQIMQDAGLPESDPPAFSPFA